MDESVEKKKKDLREKLENELYVDRYDTFKESVELLNAALKSFNINYQYSYDEFCVDFTNQCLKYIDDHPSADMSDPRQMMVYTLPIIMSIVEEAKNTHGLITE
jgi:hypothetical protein